MVKREIYLDKLRKLRDERVIKLIVGARGCGKSSVLQMLTDELLESGVDDSQISLISFEVPEKAGTEYQWRPVYDRVVNRLLPDKMNYILLDEVQNISQFERMLDGLYVKKNIDLYVASSNAWFLSPEIATLLFGRYTVIQMLPLSFKEYLAVRSSGSAGGSGTGYFGSVSHTSAGGPGADSQGSGDQGSGGSGNAAKLGAVSQGTNDPNGYGSPSDSPVVKWLFQDYLSFGAFPQVAKLISEGRADLVNDYLIGLFNTALVKDVMAPAGLSNVRAATSIMGFMLANIGRVNSPKSVFDAQAAGRQAVSRPTVASYLNTLEQAFLLYPVERYDIKAQRALRNMEKYYAVDPSLRLAVLGADAEVDSAKVLENIVYLELLRRENIVQVGCAGEIDVDFVATDKNRQTRYYQIAQSVHDEALLHNELIRFHKLSGTRKYLLTLDPEEQNFDDVQQLNLINWLLEH